jgi:hypothetical protein
MFLSQGDGEERCCGARPYSLVTNRVLESNLLGLDQTNSNL